MIVGIKDGLKLVGVSIVCACASFVCMFMLNFYVDAHSIAEFVTEQTQALYDAQLATAQFSAAITGGVLAATAVVMLIFYVKLYVDAHSRDLGVLKAMGYSDFKISLSFWVFGLSVFIGTAIGVAGGFIAMPTVYKGLSIEGLPQIEINFHPLVTFIILFAPALLFTVFASGYACLALKKPVLGMIRGTSSKSIKVGKTERIDAPFLRTMCFGTLKSKKSLAFFVAFACFCFSAMVQMGVSMEDLVKGGTMGMMILVIGVVLAVTIIIMAITALVNSNKKNVAIMKAFGYSSTEITVSVFVGYIPFALLGFAIGTAYQYGLLMLMVNVIFKNVAEVPEYKFNVPVLFITLALFIVFYAAVNVLYAFRMSKISVKEVMGEN